MTAIIIQARLGSTRLPCKIMLKLPSGRSVLEEIIYNCKQLNYPVYVASDSNLFGLADFIGSEEDVYERYVGCAKAFDIDVIIRVTGDCPLVNKEAIESVVKAYFNNKVEYAYNHNDNEELEGEGYDVEVFSLKDLIRYGKDKEHVTGNLRKYAKKIKVEPPGMDGLSINTMEDYINIYGMLS
jgi:spore coat polysaccharide biosynthesis protein SpsF